MVPKHRHLKCIPLSSSCTLPETKANHSSWHCQFCYSIEKSVMIHSSFRSWETMLIIDCQTATKEIFENKNPTEGTIRNV
jgi:hypothetical protein